ncbi:MAG: hypothetical protein F4Z15_08950 [Gammaproteobacteria bacterium]|nr:hypothetical protein [Gammaproteobacteria bacterium]MYD75193.1 hypothetical protein [Gammaproteobacteria bacterium]MYJ53289.1 hypothetical protein [Gammaproteobacteria bacterium]
MNVLCRLLSMASEKLMEVDPDSRARLAELEGKALHLIVHSPEMNLFVLPTSTGLEFREQYDREADATLHGSLLAFAGHGLSGIGIRLESSDPIAISGDSELAQSFQQVLAKIDMDREALLSLVIGDTPARKLNLLLASVADRLGESARLSRENLFEYLQEEKGILASPASLRKHEQQVQALRSDLDRIRQRVDDLEQKLAPDPD